MNNQLPSNDTIRAAARLRFRASASRAVSHVDPSPLAAGPSPLCRRSAFTLIELLVVIMIVVLLTSALVPVLSSASDARRAREGARMLATVFASAQTQAQVSGRSAGVMIQRLKSNSGAAVNSAAAMDLFMVESPPPYIGDTLSSSASVMSNSVTFTAANLGNANVQAGDLIRFSYRGELYQLNSVSGNSATISPLDTSLIGSPTGYPPPGNLPFQIYRRPVKTLAAPVQLTEGVAIDLNFSGVDFNSSGTGFNTLGSVGTGAAAGSFGPTSSTSDAGQIIITFAPTGALDMVYVVPSAGGQAQVIRPIQGVALLVGKIEKIQTPPPAATSATSQNPYPLNWLDMDSRWVVISRLPGMVTTSEVAAAPSGGGTVVTSLRYARSSQNMVGN